MRNNLKWHISSFIKLEYISGIVILSLMMGTLIGTLIQKPNIFVDLNFTHFLKPYVMLHRISKNFSTTITLGNSSFIGLKFCSKWTCRVNEGSFPLGAPFIQVNNVCVRNNELIFLSFSPENAEISRKLLSKCCNFSNTKINECDLLDRRSAICHSLALHEMRVSIANNTYDRYPSPILRGRTILLDTAIVGRYHYGHSVSKFIQLAALNETFDQIVINRMGRFPGGFQHGSNENNTREIFDFTVRSLGIPIILTGPNVTCVEDLWMIPNYEQMIFSTSAANRWRSLIKRKFGVSYKKCPPGQAFLLERQEGTLRRIINSDIVDKVASEFGIRHVKRVSISSMNSTIEHIKLFSSFGFLVSSHSSALKTLAFANPNAVVIEVVGEFLGSWRLSPFEVGMKFLNIHYVVSRNHRANRTACGMHCLPPRSDVHAPLIANITLLRKAFRLGLSLQRHACPQQSYTS